MLTKRGRYPPAVGSDDKERAKAERKRMKLEAKLEHERLKDETKRLEKEAKLVHRYGEAAVARAKQTTSEAPGPSRGVRYAESVRGVLYLVLGCTLIAAVLLGQRDVIMSFDDIVDSLFWASVGKILLALVALAFVIYGLKKLRMVH